MTTILVIGERDGAGLKLASLQAAGAAATLGDPVGLVMGTGLGDVPQALPAPRVFAADATELEQYDPARYAAVAAAAARETGAEMVLLGGTAMGKDLGPRLAAALGWSYLADCLEAKPGEFVRPNYAGKVLVRMKPDGPVVATLRPNAFPLGEGGAGTVEAFTADIPASRAITTGIEIAGAGTVELTEAGIVVAAGRGIKEEANFQLIRDLATKLGAAPAASRAIVDAGWVPQTFQVGQTGKTVSPDLYFAIGISGAIQHLGGMTSSKCIVAINKDAEAPVFKIADYGIVGDLFEVVPVLLEKL